METLKAISSRKSTRGYQPTQIKEVELETIVAAGSSAPIAMGQFDSVCLTVIQKADYLKKVSAAGAAVFGNPGMDTLYGAPTLVLISSKPNEFGETAGIANSACIIENMCLAATDLGIGSVYIMGAINGVNQDAQLVSELNLPEGFKPMAAVALGYPIEPLEQTSQFSNRITVNVLK